MKEKKKKVIESNLILKKFFNKDNEEIKKLKELKRKIKAIEMIEDLEKIEDELVQIGIMDETQLIKLEKLKRKKRKELNRSSFEERIRCSLEVINRTIMVGRKYKELEKKRKDEEILQNKDERRTSE